MDKKNDTTIIAGIFTILLFIFFPVSGISQLQADFSTNNVSGCSPLIVSFQDGSTGNPVSWKWDFGNGNTSTAQNPITIYSNPGSYDVKLTVTNTSGSDSIIKSQYIIVSSVPVVNFSASDTLGCYPLNVSFTDSSLSGSGTITTWQWDFGDGNLSSLQNPTHTYAGSGNYTVLLNITNSAGCSGFLSKSSYIKIQNGVKADFSYSSSMGCHSPTSVSFNNLTTGNGTIKYLWVFGDGNTSVLANPSNNYINTGVFTVKLITATSYGCMDTIVKTNAINIGFVKADFTNPDTICAGSSLTFTNTSNPSSIISTSWDFNDGTFSSAVNPSKIYSAPGNYQVKLVTDFGSCKDSIVKPITVLSQPAAPSFTATNNIGCNAPLTVVFKNTSNNVLSYKWDFGDQTTSTIRSPSHTYTAAGNYTVTLTAQNNSGCTNVLAQQNLVSIVPTKITAFNSQKISGCIPITINPVPTITGNFPVTSYYWDFGDGITSTLDSPTHTYVDTGRFNVKLVVSSGPGCGDSITVISAVQAGNKPVTQFSASSLNACASTQIFFSDLSTGSPLPDKWLWKFGDGTTSSKQNPIHKYRDTGYFDVTLITSSNGCPDTLIQPKYVYINGPVANYKTVLLCTDPLTRNFTDNSIGGAAWLWDFGDGNVAATPQVAHTYAAAGTYTVTLIATNGACADTATSNVNIVNLLQAGLSVSNPISCLNTSDTFTVNNIDITKIRSFSWFLNGFSQPNIITGKNFITTQYNTPGNKTPAVVITDILNCKDTLYTVSPVIIYGATADFTASLQGSCIGSTVSFIDSSKTDSIHPITNWTWNFGDGNIQSFTDAPFTHQYSIPGNYTIGLTVTDSYGCIDSISKPAVIDITKPSAMFNFPDTLICPGASVAFNNQSVGLNNTYSWQFGDGGNSASASPIYIYQNEGIYNIKLKASDQYGCTDSATQVINVIKTTALFQMSDSVANCPPLLVNFTNNSLGYTTQSWDFGDAGQASINNPSHIFTSPGTYIVKLIVRNNGGCIDSLTKKVVVKGPTGVFTYIPLSICRFGKVNFTAVTTNTIKYFWDYQEGNPDSSVQNTSSHIYLATGSYTPQVIVEDAAGCRFLITGKEAIKVNDVKAKIAANTAVLCDSGSVQFSDSSISTEAISSYKWTFSNGNNSSLGNPIHYFASPGNYSAKMVVTTQTGCIDSSSVAIKVVSSPVPSIIAKNTACAADTFSFAAQLAQDTSAVINWMWDFGNGQTSSSQFPPVQQFSTAGSYTVSLAVTNSSGCVSTTAKPVVINPVPVLTVSNDTSICANTSAQLSVSGAASYNWLAPNSGLSCTNCTNPVASPPKDITYTIQGFNTLGCSSVDSVRVKVLFPYKVTITSNVDLCIGKSVQLTAAGAPNFMWSPPEGLSAVSVANPVASPVKTTTYQVIGYDTLQCLNDTASVTVSVYDNPTVSLGPDITVPAGNSVILNSVISNDVINMRWLPAAGLSCANCPKPVLTATNNATYQLRVYNAHCYADDTIKIIVTCNNTVVTIPNAFSPNGDGINDVFYPTGTGIFTMKSFIIYNRYGQEMFALNNVPGNDPFYGWNGTSKGKPLGVGVYYYYIEVQCTNSSVFKYVGNITLLK